VHAAVPAALRAVPIRLDNPHAGTAERHTREWARELGLEATPETTQRLDDVGLGRYAALFWPHAGPEELCLTTDVMTWLFVQDDWIDDDREVSRSPDMLERLLGDVHLAAFTPGAPPPSEPIAAGLADIMQRASARMTPQWERRVARHIAEYFNTAVIAAAHRALGTPLAVDGFPTAWRTSSAFQFCLDFVELTSGARIPAALYYSAAWQELLTLALNLTRVVNDLVSLDVKSDPTEDLFNLVTHLHRTRGCSTSEATAEAARRGEQWAARFFDAEAELPCVLDQLALSPTAREQAIQCAAGIRWGWSGNIEWTLNTARYRRSGG
jgi:hypothetical protein